MKKITGMTWYGMGSLLLASSWLLVAAAFVIPDPRTTEFGAKLINDGANGYAKAKADLLFQNDPLPYWQEEGWEKLKEAGEGAHGMWDDIIHLGNKDHVDKIDDELDNFGKDGKTHKGTLYDFIVDSKYFTKLAKVVKEDEELSDLLKSTPEKGLTLFAPPDASLPHRHRRSKEDYESAAADLLAAFDTGAFLLSDEERERRPPKEILRAIVKYHVVPSYGYTFDDLRSGYNVTLATALTSQRGFLDGEAQRLTLGLSGLGVSVNVFSRVIYKYADQKCENGVLHPINRPLIPPPSVMQTLWYAPQLFSTLTSALQKVNASSFLQYKIKELTAFGPINAAWDRLPPKALAFLFSPFGQKYLKGLLAYHIVPGFYVAPDYFHKKTMGRKDDDETLVQALEDLLEKFKIPCHKALHGTKHHDDSMTMASTTDIEGGHKFHAHYRLPTALTYLLERHRKNDTKAMSENNSPELTSEDFFNTLNSYLGEEDDDNENESHHHDGGKFDTHLYVDTYRFVRPPKFARLPRLAPASQVKVNGQTVAVPNVVARNGIAHAIGKVLIPKKHEDGSD